MVRQRGVVHGCVAIVTGGASGIGRALALELARAGAFVTIVDITDDVEIVTKDIDRDATGQVTGVRADVRDLKALCDVVDDVVSCRGRIDLMVNNAGISEGGFTHELDIAHWRRVIDVNLFGVVNGIAAAYPRMVEQGRGAILNTASLAGLAPAVFVAAYTASKHAVVGLSAALRPEAALHGVVVTVLCPGAVDTPILDAPPAEELDPTAWTMTGREYMQHVRFRPIAPDRVARRALRGVRQGRALVFGSARDRALWVLHRGSPSLMDRMGRRIARRLANAAREVAPCSS